MRIKTIIGVKKIYTLYYDNVWITLYPGGTMDAHSLFEAGQNHLFAADKARKMLENNEV